MKPEETIRKYVDKRYADVWGCCFATLRRSAHHTLDKALKGDYVGARIGCQQLGESGPILQQMMVNAGILPA